MEAIDTESIVVQRIRAAARRLGRLQDVAAEAGMAASTLSAVMNGHTKLSAAACARLCDVIGGDLRAIVDEFGGGA